MDAVRFEAGLWTWDGPDPESAEHLGRECVVVENATGTLAGVELLDGVVEMELAVGAERGFHGVFWRGRDAENFESFFVRPHQVGNPDAVKYTPVFRGISSWQLYHGPGFWAPVVFPIGEWFRIRVVFSGTRGEVYVGGMDEPALEIGELKGPVEPGRVGVSGGGPPIHLAGFAYGNADVGFRRPAPLPVPPVEGIVPAWSISEAFPEGSVTVPVLDRAHVEGRRKWTRLTSEPSGLVDLARVNGLRGRNDTVYARTTVRSARAQTKALELGFSDRAVAYLDGRALYRGDDAYRSRDYRFLGSIGYYDTIYVPLAEGDNELVVAVSEDLGGWGIQARFADASDVAFA